MMTKKNIKDKDFLWGFACLGDLIDLRFYCDLWMERVCCLIMIF